MTSIDPRDESELCQVECASKEDVDRACKAANRAFTVSQDNILNESYMIDSRMVSGVR